MGIPDLPLDVLYPILNHLTDRRDWHTCTLVSKSFNQVSTRLLYRNLDSRVKKGVRLYHPSQTILLRPELAKYVRHVTETGTVHFTYRHVQPTITRDTAHALSLCTNLHSLTWTDDCASTSYVTFAVPYIPDDPQHEHPLLSLLSAIKSSRAPLQELTIRSHSDLGSHVWSELSHWTGLTKIGIWCMEGPPRVLQGWAGKELGKTLRELELGRCAGVPPTILISVLSQLPLLQDLHIKGVQASAVLTIFTILPNLRTLDTEYLDSGSRTIWPRDWLHHVPTLPTLRTLTVRTSSIDSMGPNKLFTWIRALATNPGLESFRLLTFTTNGYASIPRGFILEMARFHNTHLRKWIVPAAQMTLSDIACVCATFEELEEVACSTAVVVGDVESIKDAISSARNLQTLRLHVQWIPQAPTSLYRHHQERRQHNTNGHGHGCHSQSGSRSLTPTTNSTSFLQHADTKGSDAERGHYTGTDPANTDTDSDDSDTGISPNHYHRHHQFRFLHNRSKRDPFGFYQAGLRYSTSRNLYPFSDRKPDGLDNPDVGVEEEGEEKEAWSMREMKIGKDKSRGRSNLSPFTIEHAKEMMLSEGSKLRAVAVGGVVYTGKWVWDGSVGGGRVFGVEDVEEE